ncbi:MAG: stalk domain-containing protein [Armatimonadota bacterium]
MLLSRRQPTSCRIRLTAALILAAIGLLASAVFGQTGPTVTVRPADSPSSGVLLIVDGKLVELESAQMQRGMQVMVWVRDLEKLGWGTVEASSPDRVTFRGKGVTLSFTKDQGVAMVNSLAVQLPINVYLRDGRLMVPLSFVAKALGFDYQCQERPVATIVTEPPKTPARTYNTLQGVVTYNGAGVGGVIVRAVDPDFTVIRNAVARTDPNGDYKIEGLPDGTYMAYVYIGDNPAYFNRASGAVEVKGGGVFQVPPIALGRVLLPVRPKPGSELGPAPKGTIGFAWTTCDGASVYKLTIRKRGSDKPIYEVTTPKAAAEVRASLFTPGATYEAEVRAENEKGEFLGGTAGPGGKPWTFSASR